MICSCAELNPHAGREIAETPMGPVYVRPVRTDTRLDRFLVSVYPVCEPLLWQPCRSFTGQLTHYVLGVANPGVDPVFAARLAVTVRLVFDQQARERAKDISVAWDEWIECAPGPFTSSDKAFFAMHKFVRVWVGDGWSDIRHAIRQLERESGAYRRTDLGGEGPQ